MKNKMIDLPKEIDPCPIKESVFEIRYATNYPSDAVFGVIFSAIKDIFPETNSKSMPALQIPEAIRSKDPNLKYQPLHTLEKGNLNLRIGPRVISFSNMEPYVGWRNWSAFFIGVLAKIKETEIIEKVERIGLRYINTFDSIILDKIELKIDINQTLLLNEPTNLRTEIRDSDLTKILQVANNVQITVGKEIKQGSVIDIDCSYNISMSSGDFFEKYGDLVNAAHEKEKVLFFSLLKKPFLSTFNPVYKEG